MAFSIPLNKSTAPKSPRQLLPRVVQKQKRQLKPVVVVLVRLLEVERPKIRS